MDIPVFLFTGFLESGKSTFILDTIRDKDFQAAGKTLIIACEEGEVEYPAELLKQCNTAILQVENEEDFNEELLQMANVAYKPKQVIVEYNGMWDMNKLLSLRMPRKWAMAQISCTIDASMFNMYVTNMKSFLISQVTYADLIVINRCPEDLDQTMFRRSIKAVNRTATIIYETVSCKIIQAEPETLDYDMSSGKIQIKDEDFGIWYLDMMENVDKYDGMEVEFKAVVYKGRDIPKGYIILGRFAMTCCADDIQYIGIASRYSKSEQFKSRDWVKVKAKVTKEYNRLYEEEGPVLDIISLEATEKIQEDIVYFS